MGDTKLLFFDLDGTLWDFANRIPESTKKALSLAKERGHKIFINSGRSRGHISDETLRSLGFDGAVSGAGTVIEYQGEIIFSRFMSVEEVDTAIDTARSFGLRPIIEGFTYLFADPAEWEDDPYYNKIKRDIGDRFLSIADNRGKWEKVCKFSCDSTGGDMESAIEALKPGFSAMIHNEVVAEFVPKGFDKGRGITFLCDYLGVDIKDTFAFGDSNNDREMLERAGTGIAMGNGFENIKELSDYVTDHMHEDGIYNAMKYFSLI